MGRPRKKALTNNQCEHNPATELETKKASELLENDQLKLLSIFPEEVWDMIFDKYTDCDSLCNLYNASPYLKKLVADRRTKFLFPKVWNKVLGKMYLESYRRRRMRYPVTAFREDIGSKEHNQWVEKMRAQGRTVLWYSGILKMRMVCKTWSVAIERFYRNLETHQIMDGKYPSPIEKTDEISNDLYNFSCRNYDGNTIKNPGNFVDHFKQTHGTGVKNPFITSNVRIFFCSITETVEFRRDLETLLRKYGLHIRHLTVHGFDNNPLPLHYLTLQKWLSLMPNLETLRLRQAARKVLSSQDTLDLERYIKSNPLPELKSLKFLRIDYLPASLSKLLFQNNPGINKVERYSEMIFLEGEAWLNVCELKAMALLNLTHLAIMVPNEGELEHVLNIGKPWRLQKLNLHVIFYVQWSRIFKLLENKWEETLTDVFLQLPPAFDAFEHSEEFLSLKLNLPMVKRLKLYMRDIACLDFILPMKDSLEELEILCFPLSRNGYYGKLYKPLVDLVQTQQQIQLVGYSHKLLDSNIWTLFPKLKRVTLYWDNCYIYSREQWKYKALLKNRKRNKKAKAHESAIKAIKYDT